MKETSFIMTKREKVCLTILKRLIEAHISDEPGVLMSDIFCAQLVSKSVNMTDQMLLELKIKGENIAKGIR
jgi:hypothetical protein